MKGQLLRLAAAGACLGLLAGCLPSLGEYPRQEKTPPAFAPQALTIDLPQGADQLTQDAAAQLGAALLELSGGAVTLEVILSGSPASALLHGATHMAVLENRDLIAAEPGLAVLDRPFIAESPEAYLTVMAAEKGPVRGNAALREALGGKVIGGWYGGRVSLLCRGSFYEEICFSGSSLGVLEGWEGSDYYLSLGESLGPKTIFTGDGEELLFLLEQRSVKYLEYPLWELEPEEMPEALKYVEDTGHRIRGMWLVLGEGAVDPATEELIRAAAAYLPQGAMEARMAAEAAALEALEEKDITVRKGSYSALFRAKPSAE